MALFCYIRQILYILCIILYYTNIIYAILLLYYIMLYKYWLTGLWDSGWLSSIEICNYWTLFLWTEWGRASWPLMSVVTVVCFAISHSLHCTLYNECCTSSINGQLSYLQMIKVCLSVCLSVCLLLRLAQVCQILPGDESVFDYLVTIRNLSNSHKLFYFMFWWEIYAWRISCSSRADMMLFMCAINAVNWLT